MDGWERALLATALPERDDIPRCDDWEADQSLAGVVARVLEVRPGGGGSACPFSLIAPVTPSAR